MPVEPPAPAMKTANSAGFVSGARLARFETLDSTSLEARRRIDEGDIGPSWILADLQTAGYGRRGAAWRQNIGDLAATFVCKPALPADELPLTSIAAGVALRDALARFAPMADIRLKWPNDILIDGAKISGLLAETMTDPLGETIVSLGCGVNITGLPEDTPYPTTRLMDHLMRGVPIPSPIDLLRVFDEAFTAWREVWRVKGRDAVVDGWMAYGYGVGAMASVTLPSGETERGRLLGLDGLGALRLETSAGERSIVAGSLSVDLR